MVAHNTEIEYYYYYFFKKESIEFIEPSGAWSYVDKFWKWWDIDKNTRRLV